jgi:hypothetical protein
MRTVDNRGKIIVVPAADMDVVVIASGMVAVPFVIAAGVVVGLESGLESWRWDKVNRKRGN